MKGLIDPPGVTENTKWQDQMFTMLLKYQKVKYAGAVLTISIISFCILARFFLNNKVPFLAFMPLSEYLQISQIITPLSFLGALLLLLMLPLAILWLIVDVVKRPTGKVFIGLTGLLDFIFFVCLCCVMGYASVFTMPERITDMAEMNGQFYYLTLMADDSPAYRLYQCSENGVGCKEVFDGVISGVGNRCGLPWASGLVAVEALQEIHIFGRSESIFSGSIEGTLAPQPYRTEFEDLLYVEDYRYILYSYSLNGKNSFLVTRCNTENEEGIDCQILPVRYTTPSFQHVDIIDPKDSGNIEVWVDGRLVFSYDSTPHCHADGCVIIGP